MTAASTEGPLAMRTDDTVTSALDVTYRTHDRQFKVVDANGVYLIRAITPEVAADFGCPSATHILVSPVTRTHMVGTLAVTSGRSVRIPGRGWTSRFGIHGRFTPWGQPTETLSGHVA